MPAFSAPTTREQSGPDTAARTVRVVRLHSSDPDRGTRGRPGTVGPPARSRRSSGYAETLKSSVERTDCFQFLALTVYNVAVQDAEPELHKGVEPSVNTPPAAMVLVIDDGL